MMKLLTIMSSKSDWLERVCDEYSQKINHFEKFELIQIKSSKLAREEAQAKKKAESEAILKALRPDDYVILFDERGLAQSSVQFAKKIEKLHTAGTRRITFIIGGAFGVDESVQKRAQETWKLSELVMNHHVASTVALEQIYRAFTIMKNKPYHNE
ncbi:MAG: 23S rRNA (pseudouridine(1915)-N(3))-methyltransferase RlmH [Bdellovibrionales bacterium]